MTTDKTDTGMRHLTKGGSVACAWAISCGVITVPLYCQTGAVLDQIPTRETIPND